jgi:hypothetical protein
MGELTAIWILGLVVGSRYCNAYSRTVRRTTFGYFSDQHCFPDKVEYSAKQAAMMPKTQQNIAKKPQNFRAFVQYNVFINMPHGNFI